MLVCDLVLCLIGERLKPFIVRGVISRTIFLLPMHAKGVTIFSTVVKFRLSD